MLKSMYWRLLFKWRVFYKPEIEEWSYKIEDWLASLEMPDLLWEIHLFLWKHCVKERISLFFEEFFQNFGRR